MRSPVAAREISHSSFSSPPFLLLQYFIPFPLVPLRPYFISFLLFIPHPGGKFLIWHQCVAMVPLTIDLITTTKKSNTSSSPVLQPRQPAKMFKNTFQSGFLSVLYSIGSKPLQLWDKIVRNGHIKRITDNDIQSLVLEIVGTNVSTTYITCPADPKKTLGIKLPYLVMIVKNMKKYFTFEVQVRI